MNYKQTRLRKYYDSLRTNKPFFHASLKQEYKILRNILLFFIYRNKTVIKNKPVIAQIESTSLCNLRCRMCIRSKMGVPAGNLSFENFRKILDKLDSLFKIHLQGQGEPFLNPEIFKMIEYANKRGILIMLNTNATLLNKNIVDKICSLDIGGITVSMDSTKKELYEHIRRGAKFEKVLENVKLLTSEIEKRKRNTIVSLATVVLKDNVDELPDFINLARKLGIKKVIFQIIQRKKDYIDSYDKAVKKQISIGEEQLRKKIEEARNLAKEYGIFLVSEQQAKSPGCVWPWRSIYITWNGYVTPCCKILDYKKPFFGNILKDNFWRIWNSKHYQEFRKMLLERKAPQPCLGCEMV